MKTILSLMLLYSLTFADMATLWNESSKREKILLLIGVSFTASHLLEGKIEENERALVDCYIESDRFIPLLDVIYSRKYFKNTLLPSAVQLAAMLEMTNINNLEKTVKETLKKQ